MKKVITTEKKSIKLWLDDIEAGAFEQVKNLANLPFVFRHVAVMPDAHQGHVEAGHEEHGCCHKQEVVRRARPQAAAL